MAEKVREMEMLAPRPKRAKARRPNEAEIPDERLDAVWDAIPEELREPLVSRELDRRREERYARLRRKKEAKLGRDAPERWGGRKRRQRPPVPRDELSQVADRSFVPGVLKHWRSIHGLSKRAAMARIGRSPNSSAWRQWEAGVMVPGYRVLLEIIAATGFVGDIDPENRLEAMRATHFATLNARQRRKAQREASGE